MPKLVIDDEPRYHWKLLRLDENSPDGMVTLLNFTIPNGGYGFTKTSRIIYSADEKTVYLVGSLAIVVVDTTSWTLQNIIYTTTPDYAAYDPRTGNLYGLQQTVFATARLSVINLKTGLPVAPANGKFFCENCDVSACTLTSNGMILSCVSRGVLIHIDLQSFVIAMTTSRGNGPSASRFIIST